MTTNDWFDALGKTVEPEGIVDAIALLVAEGYNEGEAGMVLSVVAREVAHDQPARAQRYLRSFVGKSNETLMLRTLATMLADTEPDEGFEGECCWKGCHEAVTDVDVINGHEYPHCRKHHQRFQGVVEKLLREAQR